jgi:hypothetical protein
MRHVAILLRFSLKHPSKFVGKKPRKYTIPARPYPLASTNGPAGGGGAGAAPAGGAAAVIATGGDHSQHQVRVYRESSSGGLNRAQYARVSS